MAFRRQVHCVNTESSRGRITHIGGRYSNGAHWRVTSEEAIRGIVGGDWEFYVSSGGNEVDVIVGTRLGTSYLRTRDDGGETNNLLSLPACLV